MHWRLTGQTMAEPDSRSISQVSASLLRVPEATWMEDFPLLEPQFDNLVTMEDGQLIPRDIPGHSLALIFHAHERFGLKAEPAPGSKR